MPSQIHLELQVLCNVVVICLVTSHWRGWHLWRRVRNWCIATPTRSVGVVGTAVLVFSVALGQRHLPVPAIHDEFAYLLTGDTFAQGRLTNPTHPMWELMEVPHVIHRPSYQSKYPPLQGLVLAFGQAVFGHPIVGVWLSYSAACAAVVWMLQAWVPRRWAWLGGWLCALNPCMTLGWIPHYLSPDGGPFSCGWGQGYWGGALAMFGGALVFGSVPRWARTGRGRHACLFAIGLVILAASRPYEGAVASTLPMLWFMIATPLWLRRSPRRVLAASLAAAAVLAIGAGGLLIYNDAVTNDALTMPYQIWKRTYSGGSLATTLFWVGVEQNQQLLTKMLIQWQYFIRALLGLPLLTGAILALRQGGRLRMALVAGLLTIAAVFMQNTRGNPHYLAPIIPVIMLLCLQGFRRLRTWSWKELPLGRAFVRGTLIVYCAVFAWSVDRHWIRDPVPLVWKWSVERDRIQTELSDRPGKHLVFVRYHPSHSWHFEWTYNRASIDTTPVVWIQERSAEDNARVRAYFHDRQIWLVDADADKPAAQPYPTHPTDRHAMTHSDPPALGSAIDGDRASSGRVQDQENCLNSLEALSGL